MDKLFPLVENCFMTIKNKKIVGMRTKDVTQATGPRVFELRAEYENGSVGKPVHAVVGSIELALANTRLRSTK